QVGQPLEGLQREVAHVPELVLGQGQEIGERQAPAEEVEVGEVAAGGPGGGGGGAPSGGGGRPGRRPGRRGPRTPGPPETGGGRRRPGRRGSRRAPSRPRRRGRARGGRPGGRAARWVPADSRSTSGRGRQSAGAPGRG